ncbi:hypothetical protein N658DRAFT_521640 [Parathielavia hyrcaniae]|uniref:Ribosomal RNA-processing protein 17 n=1 Tax=Parathielavia hyrcaniae TaxID=113614 RepID=A0AAN6T5L6_9PEZI|nr:hypothetical protein N658DRAFT_521640 [Parathielavia hyrcaniae]
MFAQPRIRKSTLQPPPKKRKTAHTIEEITFDKDARAEYLTGFHKRKQARIKHAQEVAEEKARQERIEVRKQIREERKQAVEEHVQAINKILREAEHVGTNEQSQNNDEEWGGLSDTEVVPQAPIDVEEEYIDEDKYTTVTVEAVNVDRDGLHKPDPERFVEDDGSEPGDGGAEQDQEKEKGGKRPKDPTKKKKKFRYENKFEREAEARKQRGKRRNKIP